MKSGYRIISMFLTLLLLFGALECLVITAYADEETTTDGGTTGGDEDTVTTVDYTVTPYISEADKLATMTHYPHADKKVKSENGKTYSYQLYVDEYSGEVAEVYCDENGNIIDTLFTNPYDVGVSTASTSIKQQILSQITVKYTDNDNDKYFYSYEQAAMRNQIKVKKIKNGIRVEYTIGREEARLLLPRLITNERFETMILAPMREALGENSFMYKKFTAYYLEKNLDKITSERAREEMIAVFPIVEKYAVWVFDPTASDAEKNLCEELIKANCPDYSYEELDTDHEMTQYQGEEDNPPLFKMALEYTLDANGMTVRLPANGIRFNESLYQLTYVEVLPYMGAGNNLYNGYTMYPDGSGALFAFADPSLKTKISVTGKVYGSDYAYHTISGTYQQAIRYPVFGIQEDTTYVNLEQEDGTSTIISGSVVKKMEDMTTVPDALRAYKQLLNASANATGDSQVTRTDITKSRAFLAIIEEGDALASISTYTDATESEYSAMRMQFNPRPKDSYNIQDSISVGSNSTWTVVSNRKYVGNYKIRYVLCTDEKTAKAENLDKYYDASWFGMAVAYRDYLEREGALTRLTAEDIEDDIPLYIESFGTLETTEKILSVPVNVMTPLTTFENVKTMYDELSEAGIKNINFKLTGFANGGMYSNVPYDLKFENSVGGNKGFQELLDYAKEVSEQTGKHLGIYPDFDFAYVVNDTLFDATVLKLHASKTIDDRYASKKYYVATKQKYQGRYEMVLSPAYMSHFYKHLIANYLGNFNNVTGISVGSLGSALNSDFDEDEPYNREDAKEFTISAFEYLNKAGLSVMTEGGNSYTWKYADHILGISLDSSRYNKASCSIPFVGVILHGYKQFSDDPLNMEGDIQYAMLKILENGASPYFTLSYQNTQKLKDFTYLSNYYSVRYDIWKEDMIDKYNELNAVLRDVQLNLITKHEFIDGTRVPDVDELESDIDQAMSEYRERELAEVEEAEKLLLQKVGNARKKIREGEDTLAKAVTATGSARNNAQVNRFTVDDKMANYKSAILEYVDAVEKGWDKLADSTDETDAANYQAYVNTTKSVTKERYRLIVALAQVGNYAKIAEDSMNSVIELLDVSRQAVEDVKNGVKDIEDEAVKQTIISDSERLYNLSALYLNGLANGEKGYYEVKARYQDAYFDQLLADGTRLYDLNAEYEKVAQYMTAVAALDSLLSAKKNLTAALAAIEKATALVETRQKAVDEAADDAAKEKAEAALQTAKEDLTAQESNRDALNVLIEKLIAIGTEAGYDLDAIEKAEDLKIKADVPYVYTTSNSEALRQYVVYSLGSKLNAELGIADEINAYAEKYVLAEAYIAAKKAYDTAVKDEAKAKQAYEKDQTDALKAAYEAAQKVTADCKAVMDAYLAKDAALEKVTNVNQYVTVGDYVKFVYEQSNLSYALISARNKLKKEIADQLGTDFTEESLNIPAEVQATDFFSFTYCITENKELAAKAFEESVQGVLDFCASVELPAEYTVTRKDITDRMSNNNSGTKEEETKTDFDKYATSGNKIVAVTYGNDDGSVKKVIIINYNNFAVKVEYNGKLYTIEKFGYEIILGNH